MRFRMNFFIGAATCAFLMGTLFAGMGNAGSLEPSSTPAPTMKTLDEIPPTWSQKIAGAGRWMEALGGSAVLDKETGLVWAKSPLTAKPWGNAFWECLNLYPGDRMGWRLPTIEELASLVDRTQSNPALPQGHPFSGIQAGYYWSSSPGSSADYAWTVNLSSGGVDLNYKPDSGSAFCVRSRQ